jgi:glutathione reductase (NADPH)
MDYDFDLFVIGAGSGGVRAARIAASHGASVAVAEESRVGGTCVIRGCVPKKLLMYASRFRQQFEDAAAYGWEVAAEKHDWGTLIKAVDAEVFRLESIYHSLLSNAKVKTIIGRAQVAGPHTVSVDGKRYSAKVILIATGAYPVKPDTPGAEFMMTSNDVFTLAAAPKRIVIAGGGYIACEFAGIFNGLGTRVTQIHRSEQILRGFDDDVRNHLASEMRKSGIDLHVSTTITEIVRHGAEYAVHLSSGEVVHADAVLAATGRRSNTASLGLEAAGVAVDDEGAIIVDAGSRTSVDHIYAVGDVTNRLNLTPVAISEGHAFADTVFGNRKRNPDHSNVPSAVFSQPPVAMVGVTEAEARSMYPEIDVYEASFRPMHAALPHRDEKVLIKLIVESATDKVVGAHMVGADAGEIIQGIAIAVKAGLTKADFDATVGIHPTIAEEFVTLRK